MKYYFLLAIFFVSIFLTQYVTAIPYQSPEDLYKQSYIVLYGKVIAKDSSGSNHYDYQIRAEQYFKNPQTSDSMTVVGQMMGNETHLAYPQFEVGDMAIFYVDKVQGTYVISSYSIKAGDACDIHAFLGPKPILGEPVMRGQPNSLILTDENGGRVGMIPVGHPVIIKYALSNNYPSSRNYTVDISVQKENDTAIVFHKTQTIEVDACGYSEDALKWNFIPMQSGNFTVNAILDGNLTASASLEVNKTNLSVDTNSVSTFSPLKQFKSGIVAKDVNCKNNLQLVIKAENGYPACVSSNTSKVLVERGWGMMPTLALANNTSENNCGQFHTAPKSPHATTMPVLLMNLNSTACARLTFTIDRNYSDTTLHQINFTPDLLIGNYNFSRHVNLISVAPGKDYTHSFQINVVPTTVDLTNLPIGSNFTVVYIIKPLPNATGFYDHSIPRLACESYPLSVGHTADHVNYSDFSYINQQNYPCGLGQYRLTGVDISGMSYKYIPLQ